MNARCLRYYKKKVWVIDVGQVSWCTDERMQASDDSWLSLRPRWA
jgi:hypothetical protein